MRRRSLGKSGIEVSEVGLGAWAIGGNMWGGQRDADARAALTRARERGVNLVDTALVYGGGHSERLVGAFARETGWHDLVIATKVPPKNMQWPAAPGTALRDCYPADWIRSS